MQNIISESLDYLELTLKNDCDKITIEVINQIREIFAINEDEKNRKLIILNKLPMINYIDNKKIKIVDDFIRLKKEYGYWVFKKLEELFPEASFPLDLEAEYNSDNSVIPYYFDLLILINRDVTIEDVFAHDGHISIVDSENNIHSARWNYYISVEWLYDEKFIQNLNKALSKYNINQRIKKNNGEFANSKGAKIYILESLRNQYYKKASIDYYDILVVSNSGVRNLQLNKMGYVKENKNLNLLSKNDNPKKTTMARRRAKK